MIEAYPKSAWAKAATLLLMLLAFIAIYQPWQAGGRELNGSEGFIAAQALEMDSAMPLATAHGNAVTHNYPMYPYLASLLLRSGLFGMEECLRLIPIVFLLLSSVLVFVCAGSSGSFKAGAVAAAMYFSSGIVMEKTGFGSAVNLTNFLVLSAQVVWFYSGVRYGRWNLAWVLSLFLVALAFYAGGPVAFFYFALPLLFMRRPLSLGPKLAKWGLALGLAIVAGVVICYLLPYYFMHRIMPLMADVPVYPAWGEYFWRLMVFPFGFLMRMLPWSLIMWVPFCSALSVQDTTPIFSRYLRTLAVVLFFFVWLNPLAKAADMIVIAGPLAILTGLWYDAAVRRYSVQVRRLLALCVYFVASAAGAVLLFALLPEAWLARFVDLRNVSLEGVPGFKAFAIAMGNAMLLLAVWMNLARRKRQVWIILLASSVAGALVFWTVFQPYRRGDDARREQGKRLAEVLRGDRASSALTVYKMGMGGFFSEGYYMERPLLAVDSVEDMDSYDSRIYVLSESFPQDPNRAWVNLLPKDYTYNERRLCLWRGDLIRNRKPLRRRAGAGL